MCCRGCLLAMHWAIISWLAPIFISFLLSPTGFELCRTLMVHPGWSMSWNCLVLALLCGAPSFCFFVVFFRGTPSCCSFVVLSRVLIRGSVSCVPSWAVQQFMAWKFTVLQSLVVIIRISFGKESLGFSQSILTGEGGVSIPWFLAVRWLDLRR